MAWATGRDTTKEEDKVYCLLGIFGVFLPLIYGEGESHARIRLKEQIEKQQQGGGKTNHTSSGDSTPPGKQISVSHDDKYSGE